MTRPAAVASADWSRAPERSNPATLRLMCRIALACGRPVARLLLHPITLYFLLRAGAAGRASRHYLRRALGRTPRFADRYRHVHAFASTLLDRVYLLNGRDHLFDIRVIGDAHMRAAVARPVPGLFLFGAHFGSFEAVRALGRGRSAVRIAMAMYEDNARMINAVLEAINPDLARDVVGLGRLDSMLKVERLLSDGHIVGVLADRDLGETGVRDRRVELELLGSTTHVGDGPFRLAAVLRRPVFFMAGVYRGGNRYDIHFVPIADFCAIAPGARSDAVRAAQLRYRDTLEALCRESPFNWFNFYDFWGDDTKDPS